MWYDMLDTENTQNHWQYHSQYQDNGYDRSDLALSFFIVHIHHGCSPLFERILYMNLLIFASFPIICLLFSYALHNARRKEQDIDREFWDREQRANFTRKKPLDDLNYITIPEELLSMQPALMTEELQSCLDELKDLSACQIVNLTGYTNTDLKLKYGTANITILSDYDFHYTNLVTLLQKLAELLHDNLEDDLAVRVLEFAVSTGTDVSKSYYLLAELYQQMNMSEKIEHLISQAQGIHSLMKDAIVEILRAACR